MNVGLQCASAVRCDLCHNPEGSAVGSQEAVRVLNTDTTAQALLGSPIPARLAYAWLDGTPRVVPMWFHWTGREFLMGAPPNAPKIRPLADKATVSLVIDDSQWPYKSLTVRGTARIELLEDSFPEYGEMARRYLGEQGGTEFMAARQQTFAGVGWARITIRPEEVRILDFGAGQFPSAWAKAQNRE
jgi:hypothetical protein